MKKALALSAGPRTEEQLELAGIETVVFDRVEAHPLKSTVMAGGAFSKENS